MIGEASFCSSTVNLTKTIIGAGLLAIPLAMSCDGLVLGVALIVLAGVLSGYGLYILAEASKEVPVASFMALCELTYPRLSVLFDLSMFIQTFGGMLSYLVIIGDLLPQLAPISRHWSILLSLPVIVPLVSLRKLDSLKLGSVLGLLSIGFIVLLITVHFLTDQFAPARSVRVLRPAGLPQVISSFSILLFAFTSSQNMCSIINEIKHKSQLKAVILVSNLAAGALFVFVGVLGYCQFGDAIKGNILLNYPDSLLSTKLGEYLLIFMISLSYPLMFHPCRLAVNNICKTYNKRRAHNQQLLPLLPQEFRNTEITNFNFKIITILLLFTSYVLALVTTKFELVLALVGCTGSTLISFILPGLFGFKLFKSSFSQKISLFLTIFGALVMVVSVVSILA